jgi:hypothetical protein
LGGTYRISMPCDADVVLCDAVVVLCDAVVVLCDAVETYLSQEPRGQAAADSTGRTPK